MADRNKMGVEVNINTNTSSEPGSPKASPGSPFCIAILGDFSARVNQKRHEVENISSRRLIEIDRDNFEDVLASFNISLNLNFDDTEGVHIDIKELDDFHPDEIYDKIESFSKLRSLRRRLKNNTSFAEAAAEIQSWGTVEEVSEPPQINPPDQIVSSAESDINSANILDNILDAQQTGNTSMNDASEIDKLIKSIVAPYVEPAADPRQNEMISIVDQATQTHMQNILHHADFQALESAWLSLYFLVKRLETDNKLKIKILDISKQELQADLAVEDLTASSIYKLFCDKAEGDLPWSVLLGNYSFTDSINDVLSLVSMGSIAQQTGAPFIAAANETLAGCESFATSADYEDWNHPLSAGTEQAWQMLREAAVATYIGLALPRFLLRSPYGKKSKPIDSFEFEEMPDEHCHACYLWGNAAFLKVELLARSFTKHGWNMQPGEEYQTDNLPVHYYQEDGETVSKPAAEIILTEKGGEIIRNRGLMTLWSVKNSDSIRSSDFCSVAENGQKISGRWA